MKLIVGLGNIGEKFVSTRHNAGFLILDELKTRISNETTDFKFSKKFSSEIIQIKNLILAKPTTFMNDSGICVSSLTNFYKISAPNIFIIHDDLDIKLGEYKIQLGVGPKVHNGVNSIEEKLGTKNFWRVRVGIENRQIVNGLQTTAKISGEEYVLQKFTEEEKNILNEVTTKVVTNLVQVLSI
jgi:peptidyl-tRNA hydrolase, PTH1 family